MSAMIKDTDMTALDGWCSMNYEKAAKGQGPRAKVRSFNLSHCQLCSYSMDRLTLILPTSYTTRPSVKYTSHPLTTVEDRRA